MKKCPYCAEDIQDEAIYCKYCHKKVTGILFRRIIILIIISIFIAFLVIYKAELKKSAAGVKSFFGDIVEMWEYARKNIKELPQRAKQHSDDMEEIGKLLKQKI